MNHTCLIIARVCFWCKCIFLGVKDKELIIIIHQALVQCLIIPT